MSKRTPIAVCFSDLHLSLQAPACRAEKDWLSVQAYYLNQVKDIASGLPILFSGDLFDKWNAPPELINFALEHLPDGMICVPGQHDLPAHRIEDMHRSGYGVLVKAEKIVDISSSPTDFDCMVVNGFGWGQDIKSDEYEDEDYRVKIALIHRYCWVTNCKHPFAAAEAHAQQFPLDGYNIAIFGDNHIPFITHNAKSSCQIVNPGSLIRRKSDEIKNTPSVALIFDDGTVKLKPLYTSIDKFHPNAREHEETPVDMKQFIEELEGLGEHGLNFREIVKRHLDSGEFRERVRQIIRESLEAK